jgi:UPF0755 protein
LNRLLRAFMLLVIVVGLIVGGVSTVLTNELARRAEPVGTTDDTNGEVVENETGQIEFVIEPGETVADVANKLQANGLIRSQLLFRFLVSQRGAGESFQAGSHMLNRDMSMNQIIAELQTTEPVEETEFTIIPGQRNEQVAETLVQAGLIDAPEEFLNVAQNAAPFKENHTRLQSIPDGQGLEGYMFPDTYRVESTATVTDIIERVLSDGFDANYQTFETEVLARTGDGSEPTVHEIVTMASIVQREAANNEEMPHVAYVFWQRLKPENAAEVGNRLQADPTVQYAIGNAEDWWPNLDEKLTQDQVANHPSPYNTYRIQGLPPGPIANPGLDALRAAARPGAQRPDGTDGTGDLYFVAKCGEKAHIFARTLAEFEPLAAEYLNCPDQD